MNATKRKFNNLFQGIGSKPSLAESPTSTSSITPQTSNNAPATTPSDATAPTTPSKVPASTIVGVNDENSGVPTAPATTTTSSSSSNLLSKRRRVADALASTLGGDRTPSISSRFANNAILNRYSGVHTTATVGKIEKPIPASRYCPGDRDELVRRLGTFQELTEWTPKPDRINEIEWAKRGWTCQGKERVRCALCNKELVVKLSSDKKVDGAPAGGSSTTLPGQQVEEAMITRFTELIVEAHQEDCLWRKRGCDDSLLRLQIASPQTALDSLRERYDDLASRPVFLPYIFNLRLPASFDLDAAKSHLPPSFFSEPPPTTSIPTSSSPNDVALALAMTGWQGLTNPRIGPVPNSASCATCLRKLGLWMFKSKEVDEATGQILVAAPMDHLDPVREHRFFCPWRNPAAQHNPGSKSPDRKAAWEVLAQTLKNNAYLRSQAERSSKKSSNTTPRRAGTILHRATASVPVTPVKGAPRNDAAASAETPTDQDNLVMLGPDTAADEDEDTAARDAKDKERWARLRRVKTLFDTKNAKKMRRALSRPGTAGSSASNGDGVRPATAGADRSATGTASAAETS
ncbi:C3HC zinc finger-like-domain-containing protein [Microdochium bolleyi]|uniref:C3HC zinc finger-like-domain-containing protein n=1 Tax=Microdochium bolleyi TaxID=196109 RepID=A0A136J008_9PEZI|nr:C3HC zinc finger-like-domain-containing protein [Microdochium bolleyi]